MKIRIASSIALAAGLMLGATGCGLIAPQATTEAYAPSDGIDVNVGDVELRNVLLIADETGENFNVVFSAVNETGSPVDLSISFVGEGSQKARAEFTLPTGSTEFGNPDGEVEPVLVEIPNLIAGGTARAYFQTPGASEVKYDVPALDAEKLVEYRDYVLPADFGAEEDEQEAEADASSSTAGEGSSAAASSGETSAAAESASADASSTETHTAE